MARSFAGCGWLVLLVACEGPAEAPSTALKERSSDFRIVNLETSAALTSTGRTEDEGCFYEPRRLIVLTPAQILYDGSYPLTEQDLPRVLEQMNELYSSLALPDPTMEIEVRGSVSRGRLLRLIGVVRRAGYRTVVTNRPERAATSKRERKG